MAMFIGILSADEVRKQALESCVSYQESPKRSESRDKIRIYLKTMYDQLHSVVYDKMLHREGL
jgi:hypothetical protein